MIRDLSRRRSDVPTFRRSDLMYLERQVSYSANELRVRISISYYAYVTNLVKRKMYMLSSLAKPTHRRGRALTGRNYRPETRTARWLSLHSTETSYQSGLPCTAFDSHAENLPAAILKSGFCEEGATRKQAVYDYPSHPGSYLVYCPGYLCRA